MQMQVSCVMSDVIEVVNDHLPEGSRKLKSLASPGEVNKGVVAILREHVPVEDVAAMFKDMMKATRMTKHGEVPDWRAREAAGKWILAYTDGLPIQRVETKTEQTANNDGDIFMRVLSSPALLASLEKLFDQVKAARAEGIEAVEA